MQYTLRNIPKTLDTAIRHKAEVEHKSVNAVAVEAMVVGMGLNGKPIKYRDLSDLAGRWIEDPAVDEALKDQDKIHPGDWK